MLIDSGLLVNFWAKAIDTAKYLHNRLPIKRDDLTIISEEAWTNVGQNLEHVHIFENRISIFIPTQKQLKSDVQKTWRGIFIGYPGTIKHLRVWTPCTHQVLIASGLIVNESERGANLLIEHPLPPVGKPLRL